MKKEDPAVRFFRKVIKSDGCWKWIGAKNQYGYGLFNCRTKTISAHRFSYELLVGQIPKGLVIDHRCRNSSCVNPEHLEPVTNKTNVVLRGLGITAVNARKTHCPKGHSYAGKNLRIGAAGDRFCRICLKAGYVAYKIRKKMRINPAPSGTSRGRG